MDHLVAENEGVAFRSDGFLPGNMMDRVPGDNDVEGPIRLPDVEIPFDHRDIVDPDDLVVLPHDIEYISGRSVPLCFIKGKDVSVRVHDGDQLGEEPDPASDLKDVPVLEGDTLEHLLYFVLKVRKGPGVAVFVDWYEPAELQGLFTGEMRSVFLSFQWDHPRFDALAPT